jgi:hypothetical protein
MLWIVDRGGPQGTVSKVAGYMKNVPIDPTTRRKDTWIVDCSKDPASPGIVGMDSAYGSTSNTQELVIATCEQ